MVKTNIRKLSRANKEKLCNKEINCFCIYIMYKLGNGSILKKQLETMLLLYGFVEVEIQLAISEMLNAGLFLDCQFPGTNKKYLYLSKFCIAFMEGLSSSSNVTGVRITDRGMMLNIYRMENYINIIMNRSFSITQLIERLEGNGSTFFYKSQDALNYYLDLYNNENYQGMFTEEFEIDMQISAFETAHSKARKRVEISYDEEYAKKLKDERDKNRNLLSDSEKDRYYYNFNNLLLSNIVITKVERKDNAHTMVYMVLYDIDNELTTQKAYEKIANVYQMFSKYFKGRVGVFCRIYTYNQERKEYLEKDADTEVWDPELQKIKRHHKAENVLINMHLLPSQISDIEVVYEDYEIEKTYNILP